MQNNIVIAKRKPLLSCGIFVLFFLYVSLLQTLPYLLPDHWRLLLTADKGVLNLLLASFFYTYIPAQLITGILYDRFNSKHILTLGILISALSAAVWGMANSYAAILFSRSLLGLGAAFSTTGFLIFLSRQFLPQRFAFFTSLFTSLQILLSYNFYPTLPLNLSNRWYVHFFILTTVGLLLALAALFFIKDDNVVSKTSLTQHFQQILAKGENWIAIIYSFALWIPIAGFIGIWGLSYLQMRYSISPAQAKLAISAVFYGIIITAPVLASMADFVQSRKPFMMICALTGLGAILTILFKKDISLASMCFLLALLGFATGGQNLAYAILNDANPAEHRGTVFGMNSMIMLISGALFQPIIGILLGWQASQKILPHFTIYHTFIYHQALLVLIPSYAIALFVSGVLFKESALKT